MNATRPVTMLDLTLAEMDQRIESLQEELLTVSEELEGLATSIQATASNAVILDGLERDFENIQARYNEAVRNLNQARVNERIEVSAQGQRVTVIEGANVPAETLRAQPNQAHRGGDWRRRRAGRRFLHAARTAQPHHPQALRTAVEIRDHSAGRHSLHGIQAGAD